MIAMNLARSAAVTPVKRVRPIVSLLLAFVALVCGAQFASAITVGGVDIGTLPPGKSVTITFQNKIDSPVAGGTTQISNQATISGGNFGSVQTDDPDTATPNDATLTPVIETADLSIAKTGPATFTLGNNNSFDYTLTVTNNGPSANTGGFTVTDNLPAGTTFLASGSTAGANVSGQTVTYTNTTGVAASASVSFTIHVAVDSSAAGTTLQNTASIATTGTPDETTANDTSNTLTTTIAKANTSVAVSSSQNPSTAGESVTFSATVSSAGGTPSGTVQFSVDGAPAGAATALNGSGNASFSTSSLSTGNHTIAASYSGDGNFNASAGSLAGGQTVNAAPTPSPTPTPTPTATPSSSPTPSPTVSPTAPPSATASPTPSPSPTASPGAEALNISTRARVESGENVLIGGFIITGDEPKKVIVRALGPSLNVDGTPVPDRLADPVLELHGPNGSLIVSNDDWKQTQQQQIEATTLAPTDDRESAIVATLQPDAYTAVLSGKDGATGVALVEAYDLSKDAASQLANISTRGLVQTDDNVMIGGFMLGGDPRESRVAIRGLGPSLADSGIGNTLADPTLELRDKDGNRIELNDDYTDNAAEAAELAAQGLTPHDSRESALFVTLQPGTYTVILAGKNNTTGVGLVEIYNLR
jgi:uncharacterized repeat protein (TIGR01451 family)